MPFKMRVLALHPQDWYLGGYGKKYNCEVKHVAIGGPIPKRITGEITFDGIGEVATEKGLNELYHAVRSWKPHVFLFGIHFGITAHVVHAVKRIHPDIKIIMHYTDQRSTISKFVKPLIPYLDMLLVTNKDKTDHQKYLAAGIPEVQTFYDGVSPYQYWPKPIAVKYDCMFGGNNFFRLAGQMEQMGRSANWMDKFIGAPFRDQFLSALNDEVDLVIRGTWGWDRDQYLVKPMMYHPEYIDAMREVKILISTINFPLNGLITRRMFRSIASGRLFVTEYCQGMEKIFTNHKHVVWFRSIAEGLDVVKYYLTNDDERESIAENGRNYVVENHTFEHRLKDFVDICRRTFW